MSQALFGVRRVDPFSVFRLSPPVQCSVWLSRRSPFLPSFSDEKEAKNPGCAKHFGNGIRSLR